MIQKTEQLKDLLDRGFVLFSKNGKIEAEAPQPLGVWPCIFKMEDFHTCNEVKQKNRVYRNNRGR